MLNSLEIIRVLQAHVFFTGIAVTDISRAGTRVAGVCAGFFVKTLHCRINVDIYAFLLRHVANKTFRRILFVAPDVNHQVYVCMAQPIQMTICSMHRSGHRSMRFLLPLPYRPLTELIRRSMTDYLGKTFVMIAGRSTGNAAPDIGSCRDLLMPRLWRILESQPYFTMPIGRRARARWIQPMRTRMCCVLLIT